VAYVQNDSEPPLASRPEQLNSVCCTSLAPLPNFEPLKARGGTQLCNAFQADRSSGPPGVPPGVLTETGAVLRSMANGHSALPTGAPPGVMSGRCAVPTATTNGQSGLPAGVVDNLTCGRTSEIFSYTPSNVVVEVGQRVELWPPFNGSRPRLFAVAPELPRGLLIDTHTGLIHGAPQESTYGSVTHFVTSSEPSAASAALASVQLAVVHINVMNSAMPGRPIANHIDQRLGEMMAMWRDEVSVPALMPNRLPNYGQYPQVQAQQVFSPQAQAQQVFSAQVQQQLMQQTNMQPSYSSNMQMSAEEQLAAQIQDQFMQTLATLVATGRT